MRRIWIGVGMALATLMAACGAGRVIFNVDVYSFMTGAAQDTVFYPAVPPFTSSLTLSNPAQQVNLVPGLGQSGIDTVKVSGTAIVMNQAGGPGSLQFQVYLAADSLGTYGAGKDSMFSPAPTATIPFGVSTQTLVFAAPNLSPSGDSLFSNSSVWVRMAATVSNTGATPMSGKAVLTGLDVRVVVTDQLF